MPYCKRRWRTRGRCSTRRQCAFSRAIGATPCARCVLLLEAASTESGMGGMGSVLAGTSFSGNICSRALWEHGSSKQLSLTLCQQTTVQHLAPPLSAALRAGPGAPPPPPCLQAYTTYKLGGQISELLYSPATFGLDLSAKDMIRPRARAAPMMAVLRNTLWMWGGMVEVGARLLYLFLYLGWVWGAFSPPCTRTAKACQLQRIAAVALRPTAPPTAPELVRQYCLLWAMLSASFCAVIPMPQVEHTDVVLDDVWSLDLNKLDGWRCVKENSVGEDAFKVPGSDDDDESSSDSDSD